jgi:hypothetical protein
MADQRSARVAQLIFDCQPTYVTEYVASVTSVADNTKLDPVASLPTHRAVLDFPAELTVSDLPREATLRKRQESNPKRVRITPTVACSHRATERLSVGKTCQSTHCPCDEQSVSTSALRPQITKTHPAAGGPFGSHGAVLQLFCPASSADVFKYLKGVGAEACLSTMERQPQARGSVITGACTVAPPEPRESPRKSLTSRSHSEKCKQTCTQRESYQSG